MTAPKLIPLTAQKQFRQVLDTMSSGSIRRLLTEIDNGQIAGDQYGGNLNFPFPTKIDDFQGCFLGWAGFLENKSVLELARELGWPARELGGTDLEAFISQIRLNHTPDNDPDSAALYQFVNSYLEERNAETTVV
jgi:hypothetical protein